METTTGTEADGGENGDKCVWEAIGWCKVNGDEREFGSQRLSGSLGVRWESAGERRAGRGEGEMERARVDGVK